MTQQTFDNVIKADQLKSRMQEAFSEISSILVHHSGPFASNCIITSPYRQHNDTDEFTKDGIKILRHVLVADRPATVEAARLARFVGIAVDGRCHDGTTTSMLMFCALAQIAIKKMDVDVLSPERFDWVNKLSDALKKCLALIENIKVTDEDILERCSSFGIETSPEEVRSAVAFHMAMISSKGDIDLATKIATVIRLSPKKIYGMYRNVPLAVETEEPYILKKQEHDLAITANLGHTDHYNYRNNTEYRAKEAVIFATANNISVHSMEGMFLEAFISKNPKARLELAQFGVEKGWESFHEGRRHLVIITPMMESPSLIQTINDFNYANPTIKISWFHSQVAYKLKTSFNKTLHYMASTPLFEDVMYEDATRSLIGLNGPAPEVRLQGVFFSLRNLYKRDDEVYHPLYRDPEAFAPYTEFCRETEDIIAFCQKNITNPSLEKNELTTLTSYYRSLTCQEIYDIEVGGSVHDQRANMTVYEDAIGAALSAIEEGVILGGYAHLANFWRLTYSNDLELQFQEAMEEVVFDSMRISAEERRDVGVGLLADLQMNPDRQWAYLVAERASYRPGVEARDYVKVLSLDWEGLTAFLKQDASAPVLLQAYAGYNEQFRRFLNILPKLANTSILADQRTKNDPNPS